MVFRKMLSYHPGLPCRISGVAPDLVASTNGACREDGGTIGTVVLCWILFRATAESICMGTEYYKLCQIPERIPMAKDTRRNFFYVLLHDYSGPCLGEFW